MSELCLQGENLHLWRSERHVLRGLNVQVRAGEVLQVTGANGAGKTTLLRTLCGLMHLEEGRVLWSGRDVREDLPAFHRALLYMGHEPALKADLTACENLRFWIGMRRRVAAADVSRTLERVGAAGLEQRLVRSLSAGQRRRVALAALLLLAVPLWLLDEPTTNLDAEGQRLFGTLIETHARSGGLAIAAVHHPLAIEASCVHWLELERE